MKRIFFFAGLLLSCLLLAPGQSQAQSEKFTDKLWYGSGFGLGLSNNYFGMEVSPMVGYKITEKWSAGVRVPLDYSYQKFSAFDGSVINYSNLDFGVGGFSRFKVFRGIFAHAEFNHLFLEEPVSVNGVLALDPDDPSKLLKQSFEDDEFKLGLGYSSGGRFGYEISLLYDVLEDPQSITLPFEIRVGFNYNF